MLDVTVRRVLVISASVRITLLVLCEENSQDVAVANHMILKLPERMSTLLAGPLSHFSQDLSCSLILGACGHKNKANALARIRMLVRCKTRHPALCKCLCKGRRKRRRRRRKVAKGSMGIH
ncbi:predicted protein [Plenodomus lingam JN3]|uniref:Predicted protein n=1 Tax=Leptosphaeria maculans (strain JN3 / isolate v23.1.3 / race Av1-4-5-6-7-8) TaxID=985895 RepID=E5AFB5_LEPMJ|nr:predicted protein [Plenodomus lingam JN3]CBY01904.1 predicted protein [Plenodomus lingam JN3]